jgi:hypothetical protein
MFPTSVVPHPDISPYTNKKTNSTSITVNRTIAIAAAVLSRAGS